MMKKIILGVLLVLVVGVGLILLAQVQSHEGYFSPVYSPDGREVYFIARESRGLVAGLGIENFTPPAYVFVWHDRFSLRKLDIDTGSIEILKSWTASPVEGKYMRTYRGRAFSSPSTQLRWVDETNLEYRISVRVPARPASEPHVVSRTWNSLTNEMVEKEQWNQEWLAISGGSEPTLSGDWKIIAARGEEAFPCAIVELHSSSAEVRVLLKDEACDRVYPDGIRPSDVEQYSRRADIERIQEFTGAQERLTAEAVAAGMSEYEASLHVTRRMRELGHYATPPQLVARLLTEQEVAALRREQRLDPIVTIIEMQFTVGLFRDIEQAIRNPGQEFDKAGKYILHGDYTTSQELNAALGENVEQFYVEYAGGTYEMKIVKY